MDTVIDCSRGRVLPKKAKGTVCEYILNDQTHRCSGYVYLSGKDPQSENQFKDVGRCVDQWLPLLLVENAQTNRGQTAALESFRNEMASSQDAFNKLIGLKNKTKMLEG